MMFGVPSTKRVRRDELQSPATSPRSSPDPELTELLRSRATGNYTFTAAEEHDLDDAVEATGGDGEEAELILFAGASSGPQRQKIRLSSPEPEIGEPGFIVKRPRRYYFADEVTASKLHELQAAAIDGSGVVELSRIPWPGSALPWKVRTISAVGIKKSIRVGHPPIIVTSEDRIPRKKRKSKKNRISLRKKMQARAGKDLEEAKLVSEQQEADKQREDAEREKKTARNREKKLKKKARDKAKKLADAASENPPSTEINVDSAQGSRCVRLS